MSLQGNLRDFSVTEILQLLGTQKKTGCLELDWGAERAVIFLQGGAIVSTRHPGVVGNDVLLEFLRKIHRLSDEQIQGVLSIQKESSRDLEDVLLKGRYLDASELGRILERHILDSLTTLVRWDNGSYRFDSNRRWPGTAAARLSVESALIEASRRVDEHKRFMGTFKDPYQILGIRDLPDPDVDLSDEERELFGIIDGHRTLTEVVESAPLTEYETYEALDRMLREHWLEVIGRRDPGERGGARPIPARRRKRSGLWWLREAAVAATFAALLAGLSMGANAFRATIVPPPPKQDGVVCTRVRDLRYALELYKRDRGLCPNSLQRLVEDDWVPPHTLRLPGYQLAYLSARGGASYTLEVTPER